MAPHQKTRARITQLELSAFRTQEPDRNAKKGGRSFYFFDLDDNVLNLTTLIYLFEKKTGQKKIVSTSQFAEVSTIIGKPGPMKDFELDYCPRKGSFQNFRDQKHSLLQRVLGKKQSFLSDIRKALNEPDFTWKGPSWPFFYHAVFNARPISIITARGHHPQTIRDGFSLLVAAGLLPKEPNYLTILPLNHPETRTLLGDPGSRASIPELKRRAITRSVEIAMSLHGENPFHRFGMSDDDSSNLELIRESMKELKRRYPKNAFFVFDAEKEPVKKQEIFLDHMDQSTVEFQFGEESTPQQNQLTLF